MNGTGGRHHHATPEDRAFFESLIALRARYGERGREDSDGAIGIRHAIAMASAAFADPIVPAAVRLGSDAN